MVVDFQVIAQRRFELGPGCEAGLVDDLADASIEAFDHAIGLRIAWWDQAALGARVIGARVRSAIRTQTDALGAVQARSVET